MFLLSERSTQCELDQVCLSPERHYCRRFNVRIMSRELCTYDRWNGSWDVNRATGYWNNYKSLRVSYMMEIEEMIPISSCSKVVSWLSVRLCAIMFSMHPRTACFAADDLFLHGTWVELQSQIHNELSVESTRLLSKKRKDTFVCLSSFKRWWFWCFDWLNSDFMSTVAC